MIPGNDQPHNVSDDVPRTIKVASAMYLSLGLAFGLGGVWTLQHLARTGELPVTPFGFRSFAGGPFEGLPRAQFSALGRALVGRCALDVLAAVWLWQGRRRGAVLGLMTSLPALELSIGFALPFPLIGVPVRAALIAMRQRAFDNGFRR